MFKPKLNSYCKKVSHSDVTNKSYWGKKKTLFFFALLFHKLTYPFFKAHFKANDKRIQCFLIQYVGKTKKGSEMLW